MSAHFSAASAASTSGSSEQECASPGSANRTTSAGVCSLAIGLTSPATPTSQSSPEPTSHPLTSSAEGSPARTSVLPDSGQASEGSVRVFGASTPDSFANFDPDTSSWRTSQLSLLEDSMSFSPTWPRAGMTRSGTAFPLRPLAPLTAETASGLLHTPTAKANQGAPSMRSRDAGSWFREETWPTPKAREAGWKVENHYAKDGGPPKVGERVYSKDGVHRTWGLQQAVEVRQVWPTPKASPSGPDFARMNREGSGGDDLATAVARTFKTPTAAPFSHGGSGGELHKQVAPSGGPLNPQWVAWLMGFPIDWCSLPPSGTRSSRRSRSGSAGESSNGKAA